MSFFCCTRPTGSARVSFHRLASVRMRGLAALRAAPAGPGPSSAALAESANTGLLSVVPMVLLDFSIYMNSYFLYSFLTQPFAPPRLHRPRRPS